MIVALVVGSSTALGKLSFDAIVQRDAPDANQGSSFARFETRFQLAWVVAALIPVVGSTLLPIRVGFLILAIGAALGAFFYLGGLRAVARGTDTPGDKLKRRVASDVRGVAERVRAARDARAADETAEPTASDAAGADDADGPRDDVVEPEVVETNENAQKAENAVDEDVAEQVDGAAVDTDAVTQAAETSPIEVPPVDAPERADGTV